MSRPIAELIKDYEADPSQWEVVRSESVPSSARRNRGGTSVQELLRHKVTGEQIVRHTLVKPGGGILDRHYREKWK